ncbi:PH domain-containing protein [Mycobacteroides immunogenum]|uniref:PH domain-containing protein n=1 Tax=Mycobacteroides immunogenum TaxID=83262 RepID=UPI0025B74B83|nr:PH domain-containing protein [Mycobacteroides immunogenum]WJR33906.1 PH domain-containing protein [Mycobacteroides immunogenum]
MDNSAAAPAEWGPKTAGIVAVALVGIALGVASALFVTDAPGRLLASLAALGLLIFAAVSWRCRPKLRIVDEGLQMQGLTRDTVLPRAAVDSVKVTEFRRLGRRTRLLEIESGDRLIVLNRWDLGTDPRDVHEALRAARYPT